MYATVCNPERELARRLIVADSLFRRMKGLLGRASLAADEGLWICPCNSVHTFGMKFPIDVVFLDAGKRVIALSENLLPNRLTRIHFKAASVLELPAGTIRDVSLTIGDEIGINSYYAKP